MQLPKSYTIITQLASSFLEQNEHWEPSLFTCWQNNWNYVHKKREKPAPVPKRIYTRWNELRDRKKKDTDISFPYFEGQQHPFKRYNFFLWSDQFKVIFERKTNCESKLNLVSWRCQMHFITISPRALINHISLREYHTLYIHQNTPNFIQEFSPSIIHTHIYA